MIKKIYIVIFLFLISFQSEALAYDCNFEKIKPGVTKKELEKINIFAYGPTTLDIFTKNLFVEEICNGDIEGLHNINVMLVFYKDKLIKDNYIHLLKTSFFLAMVAILYLVYPL